MLADLIDALRSVCLHGMTDGAEPRDELAGVVEAVDWQGPLSPPAPRGFPVVERHLAGATAMAATAEAKALATALRDNAAALAWHEGYTNYAGEPDMEALRANYAYTDLVGPGALLSSECIYLGVSLQAPQTFYPPHVHKAVEVYYVIAGTAEWQRGAEPWTVRPPGSFLLHGSGVCHAMRTRDEPLLTLTAWIGDLESESVIVRA
jgi:mannose-6-phosphate isomerase-like protein (cupin superfamily)